MILLLPIIYTTITLIVKFHATYIGSISSQYIK